MNKPLLFFPALISFCLFSCGKSSSDLRSLGERNNTLTPGLEKPFEGKWQIMSKSCAGTQVPSAATEWIRFAPGATHFAYVST